jgi:predicted Fe-Mo cluster-binding NifX family protein
MLEEFMKICMPVLEAKGMDSVIYGHFGSAPFFAIYDTDKNSASFVNNNESEHEHGQCMPVDALKKIGAETVLCKGMGMRAANILLEAGITPYMVDAGTIAEGIAQFKAKKVVVMDAGNACRHHDCH